MNIQDLRDRASTLRASMSPTMSMQAFQACQARIDLLSKAIAALDRLSEAQATADRAVEECVKWG
jgi:hypothetical protein